MTPSEDTLATKPTRTRSEVDEEYRHLCMIAGDKEFKKNVLKAEIDPKLKQIEQFETDIKGLNLRMAQLSLEPVIPSPTPLADPIIEAAAKNVTQFGKGKKKVPEKTVQQ